MTMPGQPAKMGDSTAQDIHNELASQQDTADVSSASPSAVAGANNGGSPPAPTMVAGSSDDRGQINFGSGSAAAAGAQVVVSFAEGYPTTPMAISLSAFNAASQALGLFVSSVTSSGFTISSVNAPAASQVVGTFIAGYVVHP